MLVGAGDNFYQLGIAGAIAVSGSVSAAPGADVRVVTNNTYAYISSQALVNAKKDVVVAANASELILSIAAGAAASGEVSVGGAVAVTLLNDHTYAYIGDPSSTATSADSTTVNAGGNVLVSASDQTNVSAIAGSLGVGIGTAGIGASVGLIDITKDTEAFLGNFTVVNALGNNTSSLAGIYNGQTTASGFGTLSSFLGLAVQAASSETVFNLGVSGAGGFYAGIAGGVAVEIIGSNTSAYIGPGSQINAAAGPNAAQAVNVSAVNAVSVNSTGGGLGLGAAGIGGGVDVGLLENNTTAYIGSGATVSAQGDVDVYALSSKNISSLALSAAGGLLGLVGSVSVWTIGSQFNSTYTDGTTGPNLGNWSPSGVSYMQGDIVTASNGNEYSAKQDNVSSASTNPALNDTASQADWCRSRRTASAPPRAALRASPTTRPTAARRPTGLPRSLTATRPGAIPIAARAASPATRRARRHRLALTPRTTPRRMPSATRRPSKARPPTWTRTRL